MANILYLVHRMPFPPDKGDKVRSYHLLKHLTARHNVFLGTFMDDPADAVHVETLRSMCAGLRVVTLDTRVARMRSAIGLLRGEALTLPYYRSGALRAWVAETLAEQSIDAAVVFSSAMAQYLTGFPAERTLVDFVDVDSAKWTQYAATRSWPSSWVYRREGKRLLAFERAVALRAAHSFFATDKEAELFRRSAPECSHVVEGMSNGVDAEYFSPQQDLTSPFREGELAIVFTGAMDYWPNVDAVVWFAQEILVRLRKHRPSLKFYIVGRNPTPTVLALNDEDTTVTGTVPDVRPYLHYAALVVAPLRVARGIQNKVLEAMAMARPVVASQACADAVDAVGGRDFAVAGDAADYASKIEELLRDPDLSARMGASARTRVLERYSWQAHLSRIDQYLPAASEFPDIAPAPRRAR
jgi:sugar transferase (PEP-CTERM/EpsH1 system associated)